MNLCLYRTAVIGHYSPLAHSAELATLTCLRGSNPLIGLLRVACSNSGNSHGSAGKIAAKLLKNSALAESVNNSQCLIMDSGITWRLARRRISERGEWIIRRLSVLIWRPATCIHVAASTFEGLAAWIKQKTIKQACLPATVRKVRGNNEDAGLAHHLESETRMLHLQWAKNPDLD